MVRTFITSIAFAAALHASSLPTPAELSSALASAESAWGVDDVPVEFRLEPLESCITQVATEQDLEAVTTISFDDGRMALHTSQVTHVIRINSSCDWSLLNLDQIIMHEFGHVLIGPDHSKDPHSIMYPVVHAGQRITPKDRAAARVTLLKAAL